MYAHKNEGDENVTCTPLVPEWLAKKQSVVPAPSQSPASPSPTRGKYHLMMPSLASNSHHHSHGSHHFHTTHCYNGNNSGHSSHSHHIEHPNGARLLRTRSSPTFSAPVYSSRSGLEEKNSPRSPRQPVKTPSPSAGGLPPRNKSSPSLRAPITPFPVPLHQTNTQPPPPAPTRPPEPQAPAPSWPSLPVKVKQSIAPPANVTASGTTVPFQPGNASTAPSNPIGTPAPQRPRALTPIGSECYYYASKPIVPDPPPQAPPSADDLLPRAPGSGYVLLGRRKGKQVHNPTKPEDKCTPSHLQEEPGLVPAEEEERFLRNLGWVAPGDDIPIVISDNEIAEVQSKIAQLRVINATETDAHSRLQLSVIEWQQERRSQVNGSDDASTSEDESAC